MLKVYTLSCIIKIFLLYTPSRIMRNIFSCITEMFVVSIHIHSYIMKNNYCHYTSSCIMKNTLSCTKEIFVVSTHIHSYIIENTLSCLHTLLYKRVYNEK